MTDAEFVQDRVSHARDLLSRLKRSPIVIVWDPEVISEQDYADLVTAIGDLVRASGGMGIERVERIAASTITSEDRFTEPTGDIGCP